MRRPSSQHVIAGASEAIQSLTMTKTAGVVPGRDDVANPESRSPTSRFRIGPLAADRPE